ncbi:30S ribosomal protein S17 [candidate division WWE3 bacterium CG08_land_8_20_14_0_20_41_10]|uniref:30S ribosomal protein S17 n=1 Tax=candidate division WWE3 bacterium CG08_land_8_20_14_0_20_41_10 TaxID=1975085 RepID=A0A2H0XBC8_UNCKA|nr:MAG: 30S ribosomal protein S17 [candidate division WWE3 bacterium CG08_land_8_20_14_0_20_41_10]
MSVKTFTGKIVSNKMKDTVVVAVELPRRHPIYGKMIKHTKRFKAHADKLYEMGAVVQITETSPFSKQVAFKIVTESQNKEKK